MLDVAALIQTTLYDNWTETNPTNTSIAWKFDEYDSKDPKLQVLLENFPDKKVWVTSQFYRIEHRVKLTLYLKPTAYDAGSIATAKTLFLNSKSEIDRILEFNKFLVTGVNNLDLRGGWNDKDTIAVGRGSKNRKEPIQFRSEQFITAIYYNETAVSTPNPIPEILRNYVAEADYIIMKSGGYVVALDGNTMDIAFGGEANCNDVDGTSASAVLEACIMALVDGGLIFIKKGHLVFDVPVVIPFGTKSLTIRGSCGYGKSIYKTGTFLESTIEDDALFKIDAHIDERSAFGLNFEDMIVLGPKVENSWGFLLTNVDTFKFSNCSVYGFDKHLIVAYYGTTYPIAEQPGMGFVDDDCIWAEGATSTSVFMSFVKCTEIDIGNCNFGWGHFCRAIYIEDSDKIRIGSDCEFNIGDNPSEILEFIRIANIYGSPFISNQISIHDNWAYRVVSTIKWITIVDYEAARVWGVKSVDNTIEHGYTPDFFEDSPYAVSYYGNLFARDELYPPNQPGANLRDLTGICPANETYQNKWSPLTLYFLITIPDKDSAFVVKLSKDGSNWATIYSTNVIRCRYYNWAGQLVSEADISHQHSVSVPSTPFSGNSGWGGGTHQHEIPSGDGLEEVDGADIACNIKVPTGWYWAVETSGNASQVGLWAIYGE